MCPLKKQNRVALFPEQCSDILTYEKGLKNRRDVIVETGIQESQEHDNRNTTNIRHLPGIDISLSIE